MTTHKPFLEVIIVGFHPSKGHILDFTHQKGHILGSLKALVEPKSVVQRAKSKCQESVNTDRAVITAKGNGKLINQVDSR